MSRSRHWAFVDETGLYPMAGGVGPVVPEGAVELPRGVTMRDVATRLLWNGEWFERPYSPAAVLAGNWVVIANCPSGAFAEIEDADLREYLGRVMAVEDTIEITLPDPGRYRVIVNFGAPYLPSTSDIEVMP